MAQPHHKYADFEGLRQRAVALRREGLSRRQIRDRLHVGNNDILNRLPEGEPPPEWTKRPNAKDDLRHRARELRLQGRTYDQIQLELGRSKSSISLWVRDLPKPERRRSPDMSKARKGVQQAMANRAAAHEKWQNTAQSEIGHPSDRELFLIGVGLYWPRGFESRAGPPPSRHLREPRPTNDQGVPVLARPS